MRGNHFVVIYAVCLALATVFLIRYLAAWRSASESATAAGPVLDYRRRIALRLRASLGAVLLLLSAPFAFSYWPRLAWMAEHQPWMLFIFVLPLAGLFLVLSSASRPRKRPGRLQLEGGDPRTGGVLRGRYHLEFPLKEGEEVAVHLALLEVGLLHAPVKEVGRIVDKALWKETERLAPHISAGRTEIPFHFRIPDNLPASGAGEGRYEWVLVFEGGELGVQSRVLDIEKRSQQPGWACDGVAGSGPTSREAAPSLAALLQGSGSGPGRPRASIVGGTIVVLMSLGIWFAFDASEKPWLDLFHSLPNLLVPGFVALCFFSMPLVKVLSVARPSSLPGRLAKRVIKEIIIIDALVALGVVVLLFLSFTSSGPADTFGIAMKLVERGVAGLFFWLGLAIIGASLAGLARGDAGAAPAVEEEGKRAVGG